ncbi:MAG: DUF1045 domain-containing protein [Pseudomonadota bacterium]
MSWVPCVEDAFYEFGVSWTGWCPISGERTDQYLRDKTEGFRPALTADIEDRGLYGNIRSPFRLATGRSRWALDKALDALARQTMAIRIPGFRVGVVAGRVGLGPSTMQPALFSLIDQTARAVRLPQAVPAPAHPSVRTQAMSRHGDNQAPERFFVPLTGLMQPDQAERVSADLEASVAPLLERPVEITNLALMGDPGGGRPWRLVERYQLSNGVSSEARGQVLEVIG